MSTAPRPIPEGYHSVTPYLVLADASAGIEFYKQAFGAEERYRMPGPGGRLMHAELQIGDSVVMLADENPEAGALSPQSLGGTPASLLIYTEDVDAAFARALASGAKEVTPPSDMFWGDRYGRLEDPWGHQWSLATHIEDVEPDEMMRRAETFLSEQASS